MAPSKSNKSRSSTTPTAGNESTRRQASGKSGASTSGNREESMTDSGDDEFARGDAARNANRAGKSGQGKGGADMHQSPRESGTTSLGGETPGSDSIRGPGGVEGSGGE